MVDIADTRTGGQRASFSRRSRASAIREPAARERLQPTERRQIIEDSTSGLFAIGESVGRFFGTTAGVVKEYNDVKRAEEDAEAADQAFAHVFANRKEAVEAVRTGDYSKLPDHVRSALDLKVGYDEFRRATGVVIGEDLGDNFIDQMLANPNQDPRVLQQNLLQEELKGANPVTLKAATEQFLQMTEPSIDKAQDAERTLQVENVLNTLKASARAQVQSGQIYDEGSIQALENRAARLGAMVSPEAAVRFQQEVIYEAILGVTKPGENSHEQQLAFLYEKNDDGLSIYDRYKDSVDKAEAKWLSEVDRVRDADQAQELFAIRTNVQDGVLSPQQGIKAIRGHENSWGATVESRNLLEDLMNDTGTLAVTQGAVSGILDGNEVLLSADDWSKAGLDIVTNTLAQASELPPEQQGEAFAQLANTIANSAPNKKVRGFLSNLMNTTQSEDAVRFTQRLMEAVDAAGGDPDEHLNTAAQDRYNFASEGLRLGDSVESSLRLFDERRRKEVKPAAKSDSLNHYYGLKGDDATKYITEIANSAVELAIERDGSSGVADDALADLVDTTGDLVKSQLTREPGVYGDDKERLAATVAGAISNRLRPTIRNGEMVMEWNAPRNTPSDWSADEIEGAMGGPLKELLRADREMLRQLRRQTFSRNTLGEFDPRSAQLTTSQLLAENVDIPWSVDRVDFLNPAPDGSVKVTLTTGVTDLDDGLQNGEVIPLSPFFANTIAFKNWERTTDEDGNVIVTAKPGKVNDQLRWVVAPGNTLELRLFRPEVEDPMEGFEERRQELMEETDDVQEGRQPRGPVNFREGIHPRGRKHPGRRSRGPTDRRDIGETVGEAMDNIKNEILGFMKDDGELSAPEATEMIATPAEKPGDVKTIMQEATRKSRMNAPWMFGFRLPEHRQFREDVMDMLVESEGMRTKAYKDTRGNVTIGIGINLDAKANSQPGSLVRTMVEDQFGVDYEKLRKGEERLTYKEARVLTEVFVEKASRDLARLFTPEERMRFNKKQWMGMIDIYYQAPALFHRPTNMMAALKRGDWDTAIWEIANNTYGGVGSNEINGLVRRRFKQGAMLHPEHVTRSNLHSKVARDDFLSINEMRSRLRKQRG